ncbi:hypothetical protein AB0K48_47275, partial [Nonomuraea sp. NPDC055795]
MHTFDTPGPIHALVEFGAGEVRVDAGPYEETSVEVTPADPARAADVDLAGSGMGLIGLRRSVSLLGGAFAAEDDG